MKNTLILLAVISLAACSTPSPVRQPVANPAMTWQKNKSQLAGINNWVLNGRVAIINGDESWHLSMKWQRHADKYILDLSGPFGAGHAQLTGTDEGVVLVDADQNYFYAESPDHLLQDVTGVRMPVKSLLYWMRGIPALTSSKQQLDEFGRLKKLEQNNWRVRYKSYVKVNDYELPQKIFIDGHQLKVKIFVDEWDLSTRSFNVTTQDKPQD